MLLGAVALLAGASAAQVPEYALKAEFLERFTRFVDWPGEHDPRSPFVIGVYGSNPFGSNGSGGSSGSDPFGGLFGGSNPFGNSDPSQGGSGSQQDQLFQWFFGQVLPGLGQGQSGATQ